ncbi:VOC family protein [Catellatospora tritici]|uniref:VOC family protein n=1 Tax=Catellatospora tritici TaxID=2851566 RepID=UPI001C2D6C43|nr:VOC family protein [Catellatospora tritici]MBV1855884.1 VOC family protein [Catellatospora tritici]
MAVQLNHTIVFATDRQVSAEFLAGILGLRIGRAWGPFLPVGTDNGVTLDFATVESVTTPQHYAFLVTEEEFDAIFERIKQYRVAYYADPHGRQPGEINHNDGGRGVYFTDPDGHGMEVITVPYGGWQ